MRRAGLTTTSTPRCTGTPIGRVFSASQKPAPERLFALTTKGTGQVFETGFQPGDWLVFGAETRGLSDAVRSHFAPQQCLKLPMIEGQRSLNLSNAVAVTVFEAGARMDFRDSGAQSTRQCTLVWLTLPASVVTSQVICMPLLSIGSHAINFMRARNRLPTGTVQKTGTVEAIVHAHAGFFNAHLRSKNGEARTRSKNRGAMGAPNGPALARSTST